MTTTDTQELIIPYIGETSPYTIIPEHIILKDNSIETELNNCNFENENFLKFLKTLASLASCSLHQVLSNSAKEKTYFIGEKLRIKKISYKDSPASVTITGESILESGRRGKTHLTVKDKVSEETVYSFELDHYIITKETFKALYKNYFEPDVIMYYDEKLPKTQIIKTSADHQFIISIDPFTPNQCKSHFENYPIVPFLFVMKCILREIFRFFGADNCHEINNLEGHPTKAIPIETKLEVDVFYQTFLKDQTYIKCEIKDASGYSYAVLMINLKSKYTK
ncbi:hypothetical protein [Chryseobacterium sp. UNC8MFCol]|uniref:hypothetical protein n=1 Tax=Chryseobacterium sp. UNC8MFCol TaxID=1340435 RepID=UPI000488DA41|nr:hypothetical protein [Chryseobacterium sp. UNC8MFCol]